VNLKKGETIDCGGLKVATSRSQGGGVERPILLNNQLGAGKSAKSTKNGAGMLP
jgi:hypothetical protein